MNVLEIAKQTSLDLWSAMTRRQRETPEKVHSNPHQWLADEVHTMLEDYRTDHFYLGTYMKDYEEVVCLAETNQLPEEDQYKLEFSRDAVREYQALIQLEADLAAAGHIGTNLNPRKYRVSYDRVFLAHPPFEYKGDLITGASLDLTFKCFKDGKEILFGENEGTREEGAFHCSVNKDHGFAIEHKSTEESYYDFITCEATHFFLDYYEGRSGEVLPGCPEAFADYPVSGAKPTTKEEFIKIIQGHWENFDNSDNRRAQNCAWCHEVVPTETT